MRHILQYTAIKLFFFYISVNLLLPIASSALYFASMFNTFLNFVYENVVIGLYLFYFIYFYSTYRARYSQLNVL